MIRLISIVLTFPGKYQEKRSYLIYDMIKAASDFQYIIICTNFIDFIRRLSEVRQRGRQRRRLSAGE
jgi:hypothetical protein